MQDEGTKDLLNDVVFVLDRPRDIVNVGAVVRLLGNFGLSRLRLVEPAAYDEAQILRLARRGHAMLANIERHASLGSALADCVYVLGTTRRTRALDRPVLTPRQAARTMLSVAVAAPQRAIAVLFGPEDFGLANAALDRCHAILTIPAVPDDASLNLAQAALLVAYELRVATFEQDVQGARQQELGAGGAVPATSADLERMFEALRNMLVAMHPAQIEGRTNSTMARLRALLLRAMPTDADARLLTTIFQHVAHGLPRPDDRDRS